MAGEVRTEYSTDMEVLTAAFGMTESEIIEIVLGKIKQGNQGRDLLAALQDEIQRLKARQVPHRLSLVHSA